VTFIELHALLGFSPWIMSVKEHLWSLLLSFAFFCWVWSQTTMVTMKWYLLLHFVILEIHCQHQMTVLSNTPRMSHHCNSLWVCCMVSWCVAGWTDMHIKCNCWGSAKLSCSLLSPSLWSTSTVSNGWKCAGPDLG
jgi:hypothetical protein